MEERAEAQGEDQTHHKCANGQDNMQVSGGIQAQGLQASQSTLFVLLLMISHKHMESHHEKS